MLDWLDCYTKVCPSFFFGILYKWPSRLMALTYFLLMLKEEDTFFCVRALNLLYVLLQGDCYLGGLEECKITILWWVIASICLYYIWSFCIKEAIWSKYCVLRSQSLNVLFWAISFEQGFDLACEFWQSWISEMFVDLKNFIGVKWRFEAFQ